jgi:hypothetical protein
VISHGKRGKIGDDVEVSLRCVPAMTRCPRCGAAVADAATSCVDCARPVTLDMTARVPKKIPRRDRRPLIRDAILLIGGIGGIVAAGTAENWLIAASIVLAALLAALIIQYA